MQAADGTKAHEPQFWTVLQFDSSGKVLPLKHTECVTLQMRLPQPNASTGTALPKKKSEK
eukprot:SAG31_NODE_24239_length_486_cov_0.793282_1_plen_59_part_10